jgi:hypothetical protein
VNSKICRLAFSLLLAGPALAIMGADQPARFDAAPFGAPLPEGNGLMWEDPREIHEVIVRFKDHAAAAGHLRLEYWGSRWPEQHLPKNREPGGGDVGWMELGNWHQGGWRVADTGQNTDGNTIAFTFRPVNEKEFPKLKDYDAPFRYTLKIRVAADTPLPPVENIRAFTDSRLQQRIVRLAWKEQPTKNLKVEVFNGALIKQEDVSAWEARLILQVAQNSDPNTFDRTLVTVGNGGQSFTFKVDDLDGGPLYLPEYGVAILPDGDSRDFAAAEVEAKTRKDATLYDRVAQMPEQTWKSAWAGMPPKKSRICFPLGLDGARQKFRLDANGEVFIRWNDQYMLGRPGRDTARLRLEKQPVHFRFGLPDQPVERHTEEESLPICVTTWDVDGMRVQQTAFATELEGAKASGPPPAPDVFAVAMMKFVFANNSDGPKHTALPITIRGGEAYDHLRIDTNGLIWNGTQVRGQVLAEPPPLAQSNHLNWSSTLAPHESRTVVVKMPYLPLTEAAEQSALDKLDFEREHAQIAGYWRRRLDESAKLTTPEPVLNEFYRAEPGHLLINSEFDPGGDRRFARVGSFNYGVYGNESCMMVADLDRRGYHREAAECLEAWLHYQGTVGLPGDFSSKEGVLYGAGGYEAGGYNQHHGWILWTLAEHYRFTRDEAWLRHAAPGILAGAEWIIRETGRAANRPDLARGLLPAGGLEDIGDWWTWLSTSCYTWRGLDSAAWALEQIHHPEAGRIRQAAAEYHKNLIANFMAASARSPVVRLRDGTAVPQIPSYVQRRGRSFGWICQTLEGAMHLLITRAMDGNSPQAGWILRDYEDNLYLSNQYGYTLDDFDKYWFGRGGMSMQACLLLDVEPYLYRDDVKQALRAMFNAIAVCHFPDVHMNTEHALPEMGDWRGDHYKTSDEANACGWLRQIFIREDGNDLLLGQAIPRDWLKPGEKCGLERAATYFGPTSVLYTATENEITAVVDAPTRNPPKQIRLRFREPNGRRLSAVIVNGKRWNKFDGEWVRLPGDAGKVTVVARYGKSQ